MNGLKIHSASSITRTTPVFTPATTTRTVFETGTMARTACYSTTTMTIRAIYIAIPITSSTSHSSIKISTISTTTRALHNSFSITRFTSYFTTTTTKTAVVSTRPGTRIAVWFSPSTTSWTCSHKNTKLCYYY